MHLRPSRRDPSSSRGVSWPLSSSTAAQPILIRSGHTLGSHTWSHANLQNLDYNGINNELERLEEAFIRILGLKPLYFRPPYGSYNDLVLQVLGDRGYKSESHFVTSTSMCRLLSLAKVGSSSSEVFLWNEDTGDANGESVQYSEGVIDDAASHFPQPNLILSHSVIDTSTSHHLANDQMLMSYSQQSGGTLCYR